jgi:integrase/recombinase XerC/integrase/recombinase XerD
VVKKEKVFNSEHFRTYKIIGKSFHSRNLPQSILILIGGIKMKLKEAKERFLEYQKLRGNSLKTIEYYEGNLSRLIEFLGDVEVDTVSLEALHSYIEHLRNKKRHMNNTFYTEKDGVKVSSISIQTYVRAIRAFLAWLYKHDHILTNFSSILPLPKARQKQTEILSDEQIKTICASFGTNTTIGCRNAAMFNLMLDTGIRLNEAIGLKLTDVDFGNCRAKVLGKGDKERMVFFGSKTKAVIKRYIDKFRGTTLCNNLFLSGEKPMTENAVKLIFSRISKDTGIAVHAHLLRHTFSTKFLINGGNVFELQMLLGHTTLTMTQKYVHLASVYNTQTRRLSIMDSINES